MLVCVLRPCIPLSLAVLRAIEVLALLGAAYLGVIIARATTVLTLKTVAPVIAIFPKVLVALATLAAMLAFRLYRGPGNQPGYVSLAREALN